MDELTPWKRSGDSHVDFLGESEGSHPPPHDSFPDAGEAINDFWWQGVGVPKAGQKQAAADSQGSRTCVCASTLLIIWGWHTQEEKDELTSCRVPSSRRGKNLQ